MENQELSKVRWKFVFTINNKIKNFKKREGERLRTIMEFIIY